MSSEIKNRLFSRALLKKIMSIRLIVRDAWLTSLLVVFVALVIHNELSNKGFLLGIALSLGYTFAFILNDYYDSSNDKHDQVKAKRNVFTKTEISEKNKFCMFFSGIAVLLGFALVFGVKGIIALIISLIIAVSYSAPPLRLKSRPGIDLLIHGIFMETYPYALTIYLLNLSFLSIDYFLLSLLFLNSIITQIEQQLRDYETDTLNDKNFTTWIGKKRAFLILKFSTILLVIYALFLIVFRKIPVLILVGLFIALPFQIHRLLRKINENRSEKLHRLLIGIAFVYFLGVIFFFTFLKYENKFRY